MNAHSDNLAQLVAAIAIRLPARTVSFAHAARLAYLVDREAMRRHGFPVVDDRRISTARGGALCLGVLRTVRDGCNPELAHMAGRTPGGRMFSNTEDLICTVDDAVCDEDLDLFSRAEIYVIDDVVGRWGRYDCREIDDMMSDRDLFPELDGLLIGMEVSENAMFSAVGDLDPNGSVERLRDIRGINELFAAARAL